MPIEWAVKGSAMAKIVMSIHPEHVEKILLGLKKYEYRKAKCKHQIDAIVIYSTYPVMKVVGEVSVNAVLEDTPKALWDKTKDGAGIDYSFFKSYYNGCNKAIAYSLGDVVKYEHSKKLIDYGLKAAPQSFVYIT